eukprot:604711-Pelagomonas_calceolata.AAC.2
MTPPHAVHKDHTHPPNHLKSDASIATYRVLRLPPSNERPTPHAMHKHHIDLWWAATAAAAGIAVAAALLRCDGGHPFCCSRAQVV